MSSLTFLILSKGECSLIALTENHVLQIQFFFPVLENGTETVLL